VSRGRAPQLVAGAIVADAAMDLFEVPELEVCPWALREGVILRRLDVLPGPSGKQPSEAVASEG
jgi:exopolyphosphatase/guanosine-5'-triphosphate,3'-diphosphate pyrophosphatase